jgi:hypothetical protein
MRAGRFSQLVLAGAATASACATSDGALVIDVVATGAGGGAVLITPKLVDVTNASPGAVVSFDVFANVTDSNNNNTSDQGIYVAVGSFLSSPGLARGNLAAQRAPSMTFFGSSNGLVTDLDSDGDLDVGSNNNAVVHNFFNARSIDAPLPQFGSHVLIGTMQMVLSPLESGPPTLVNFRQRISPVAAGWYEDGTLITSSAFSAGAPVVLTIIPEPASLGAPGIAAVGLLARRRTR